MNISCTESFICSSRDRSTLINLTSCLTSRRPPSSQLCLPLQVKLSRLCEQDRILKDLEATISSLKEDKVRHQLVMRLPPESSWAEHSGGGDA